MKNKHDLQKTCDHPKATLVATNVEHSKYFEVQIEHLHCARCGMFFSRELIETRRTMGGRTT